MKSSDIETIVALRRDLALQLARWLQRLGVSQAQAARQLQIPQPTLSKIARCIVDDLSLELLLRIAVRAKLPVTLQTGQVPEEAGAFVSLDDAATRTSRSRLADAARDSLTESVRHLTPEQRLDAYLRHGELVTSLYRAGQRRILSEPNTDRQRQR